MKNSLTKLLAAASMLLLAASPGVAADIVIINSDGAGEGFNDPTPVAPINGNPGTTLGAQRLNVMLRTAEMWGAIIVSDIEIRVRAQFNPLFCSAQGYTVGSTGTQSIIRDFTNAPLSGTWFHGAIADAIAGVDHEPAFVDISMRFNILIDEDPNCAPGQTFYYGLDSPSGGTLDLLPTALHEMAHGLGFSNFINEETGALFNGFPDVYSHFTYDVEAGLHWDEMTTNLQRRDSAINTGELVWDGPEATGAAPTHLERRGIVHVNSPPVIEDDYLAEVAQFGGAFDYIGFDGDVEVVDDGTASGSEGCNALVGFTPGNIALIDRGTCEFGVKVLNAEDAGASAAIVANCTFDPTTCNNVGTSDDVLILMGAGTVGDQVTIPAEFIGYADGQTIRVELPGVNTKLGLLLSRGLHPEGWPLLYAPDPVRLGSSVSHWDAIDTVVTFPNAPNNLMEPFTSTKVFDQLDFTPNQFRDVYHEILLIHNNRFDSGPALDGWSAVVNP